MTAPIIRSGEGQVLGSEAGVRDRFLVDSAGWDGRIAIVEHLLAPRSIAAPLHRHTREDEFSYVLAGDVWLQLGDDEHVAHTGDLVLKPRNQWHTFWNASDQPARVLEIITPGGLEELFRMMGLGASEADIAAAIGASGCEGDPERTEPIIERYGLTWG